MALRIGTAERGGTFHTQGLALKTIFERDKSLFPVEVRESAQASIENANRLHAGEIDLGFIAANWIGRAMKGEPPFAQPIELRMVAPMNSGPLFFIARADSQIRTIADLRGRRVVVGPERSGMAQHAHSILAALGMGFRDLVPVYLDFASGAQALAGGEADAQLQCPIPNRTMTELAERVDVRVLRYGEGQLEKLLEVLPCYRRTLMRKGAFRGLDADLPQAAVVNVLVAHARAGDQTVRAAARAIVSGAEELGRINPLFAGIAELLQPLRSQGPAAIEFGGVALHAGAILAYRDLGLLPG